MYPKRMKWVEVFLMKGDIDRVVTRLHEERILEVRASEGIRSGSRRMDELVKMEGRIVKALDFLLLHEVDEVRGIRALIPRVPDRMDLEGSDLGNAGIWVKRIEREIAPMIRSLRSIEEEITFIMELREKLLKLSGLEVELGRIGILERTRIRIGLSRAYPELKKVIEGAGGLVESSLLNKKEGLHAVRLIYPRSLDSKINSELRGVLFSEMTMDIPRLRRILTDNGYPSSGVDSSIVDLLKLLDKLEERIKQRGQDVRESAAAVSRKELGSARSWEETISIEVDKVKLSRELYATHYTNMISGWVEKNRISRLRGILKTTAGPNHEISIRDPTEEDIADGKVPTSLSNSRYGRIFESLTLTFSPPRYDEIDPTFWLSIPFILFFGLMLGDAGYGTLIFIASFVMWKWGKNDPFLNNVGMMGMILGGFTIMSGLWMGSVFGDLIPRLIYGNEIKPLYGPFDLPILGILPYDSLRKPMKLFSISLWLGIIQMNLGLVLLGYHRIKNRQILGIIWGVVSWIFIQAGAFILLGGTIFGYWGLSSNLAIIGLSFFMFGSLLLILEKKGMFFFSIEGFVGDWISYSRILALGLSTFGLAMAFNIVGEMVNDISLFLLPITIVLLVFLHIFNLLIQTLGATVHSLRLQYVEFFNRFYEGGGVLFAPFGRERTYTRSADRIQEGRK